MGSQEAFALVIPRPDNRPKIISGVLKACNKSTKFHVIRIISSRLAPRELVVSDVRKGK